MAQIDKTTVRNEVSRIKADFEQLCARGKITSEIKILMNSMFMIMELMLSIFLEKATKKDNKNSSIPSSQTDKDESALEPAQGSNGKGKNEKPLTANNTRITETLTTIEASLTTVNAAIDEQKLILFLKKWLSMLTHKSNNAHHVRQR